MEIRVLQQATKPKAVLVAEASSPLTRALAQQRRAVMRHVWLAPLLRRVLGDRGLLGAEHAFAFVTAVEEREEDIALVVELARLLGIAGRKVARVRLATFEGIARDAPCRVVKTSEDSLLSSPEEALERPWGGAATLFLNTDHTRVRLARRRAKTDIGIAAHLLCRTILVAEGPLDAKVVDRLLESAGTDG